MTSVSGSESADSPLASGPYPAVPARPDLPALERRVLDRWERENTFEASMRRDGSATTAGDEFVFLDGPPFANGLPHYGHLLTGYVKDIVPRYQTMRGKHVERRFGWDCHGLPAEMQSETELGVHGREEIAAFGIAKFNEHCRASVMSFTEEWEHYVTRQARWVDFAGAYRTMDISYMESVLWAFKELWNRGLIYEDHRVMPYSWGAQTPLSNFEVRLDDAMRPRTDPAATVAFRLTAEASDPGPIDAVAWTTMPWTLPSNRALAVHPGLDYLLLERDGAFRLVAESAHARLPDHETWRIHSTLPGARVVGRSYQPLFPYFAGTHPTDTFPILASDLVEADEGTGIVHLAPSFGEMDQAICGQAGIHVSEMPVDDAGNFTDLVPEWAGTNVFEANDGILRHLEDRGHIVAVQDYEHDYPHCWRTDTPIIYRAVRSWFVAVTKIRDRMIELNESIRWTPEHVRDGAFGKWLEGARDWSISRNRFWGTPIPVWLSDDPEYPRIDVYGSIGELERDFGITVDELHRPFIDTLVRPNPDDPTGRSMMRRCPEVLDCWFESGAMPFAQLHYPFENAARFERSTPADFIVEYAAQTRGWFYTLHVLSTALFDRPAFRSAICHGVVLDPQGRKLSKRLRNFPDPIEVFEDQGSDALRWFLVSSPVLRGLDLRIERDGEQIREVVRSVLHPIWSALHFYTLYANVHDVDGRNVTVADHPLDRFLLGRTGALIASVTAALDRYDFAAACAAVTEYLEILNNWYIRCSRTRFWNPVVDASHREPYDVLFTALTSLTRVVAPLLPLLADELYRTLTRGESVHLTAWPTPADFPVDGELDVAMDHARAVISAALHLREQNGLRLRLPLPRLTVAGEQTRGLDRLRGLLCEEANVKEVILSPSVEAVTSRQLRPDPRALGPRLGPATQQILTAAKAGEWHVQDDGTVRVLDQVLSPEEFELVAVAPSEQSAATLDHGRSLVLLDTRVTPVLEREGLIRDVVRHIQQARKAAHLDVSDRVELTLRGPDRLLAIVRSVEDAIREQVLAGSVVYQPTSDPTAAPVSTESLHVDVQVTHAANEG